jgi:exodeoxyribonuclease VII small subunit
VSTLTIKGEIMPIDPNVTFQQAYEELQTITKEFETGDLDLEQSIPKFTRATELVKFLKTKLKDLETQIEQIDIDGVEKIKEMDA